MPPAHEPQQRPAPQRVAMFLLGYFAILFAMAVPKGMVAPHAADLTWGILSSLGVLALTTWMLRRESREPATIGLVPDRGTPARLLLGAGIGLGVYGITVWTISALLGPVTFTPAAAPRAGDVLLILCGVLALACMEELGFRGYPLRTLIPVIGLWPAQLSTAVLFGLGHLAFGWSWASVLLGVVPSALLFGAAAVRFGGLAAPIGLHAAVNIAAWAVGAKETAGLWTPSVGAAQEARVALLGPMVGLVVTLGAAWAVGRGATART
jgi:membrane protease YdiL (CAAX protease family)